MDPLQAPTGHHGGVLKAAVYIGAWLFAGVAAVTAATIGVSMVGEQVTAERPAPLSATQVRDELAIDTAPSVTSSMSADEDSSDRAATASGDDASTTTAPSDHTAPANADHPPAAGPVETTRTYSLVGGTAILRFAPTGVTVVTATPNHGYSVDVEQEHGNGVKVEFESDAHESRVDGWWADGPVDRVRERD